MLKTEILLKEASSVLQMAQKASYSYSFKESKILDPLGLSVTLKGLPEDGQDLGAIAELPEIKSQVETL